MWFPDLGPLFKLLMVLSCVGVVSMVCGVVALLVWLFTHVDIRIA
jgi:hypothetical protein